MWHKKGGTVETPIPMAKGMWVFGFIFKIKHFLKYNNVNIVNWGKKANLTDDANIK